MTTTLDALKAAREALVRVTSSRVGHLGDHSVYCPQMDKERTDSALTLLDAAIQREEGGCAGADGCHPGCRASACSCPCHAAEITPTPPSGVVSREAAMNAAMVANAAGLDSQRWETVGPTVARALSAPSESMVARSQALRAIREALDSEPPHDGTTTAEDEAARILDGGGHE